MEVIPIRFEQSDTVEQIEIVVRAAHSSAETDALIEKISGLLHRRELHVLDTSGSDCIIDESDIISVCASDRQVKIITRNDIYTSSMTLRSIEEILDKRRFIKISRYEIVNSEMIIRFDFTIGGTLRLELEGGIETWASRRFIPLIRKHLLGKEDA